MLRSPFFVFLIATTVAAWYPRAGLEFAGFLRASPIETLPEDEDALEPPPVGEQQVGAEDSRKEEESQKEDSAAKISRGLRGTIVQ